MKIAVYGSAAEDMDPRVVNKARALGAAIAKRGHTLVTGACTGLPHEAVLGAAAAGGKVIGFSPAVDLEEHKVFELPYEGYTEFVFVPRTYEYAGNLAITYKFRNVSSVATIDACIFLSGRTGTLNEYTLAYDFVKPIGSLLGSGGVADFLPEVADKIRKLPRPPIFFSDDIDTLLDNLETVGKMEG